MGGLTNNKQSDDVYLEYVVGSVVAVPVFSQTLVSQTKLESVSSLERRRGKSEAELVCVGLRAADDVLRLSLPHSLPVVHRPPDYHRLVEREVHHSDDPLHRARPLHEGVLQTDLLAGDGLQEVGGSSRLVEHRDQGELRGAWNAVEGFRKERSCDGRPDLKVGKIDVQVSVGGLGNFRNVVHEDFNL